MNANPMPAPSRSVQLAVLGAPSTTIDDAVAESRRRIASLDAPRAMPVVTRIPRTPASVPAAA